MVEAAGFEHAHHLQSGQRFAQQVQLLVAECFAT